MTTLPTLKDFDKFFIGFDEAFNTLQKSIPNYPPYSIKKTEENTYTIEMAVAGFAKQDLEVNISGDTLTIKGNSQNEEDGSYLYKGLALRPFERTFSINDKLEVANCSLVNGILKVVLDKIVELENVTKVEIKDA